MGRLSIFAKGNVDVHDTLHSCRIGGARLFAGINEVLRARYPAHLVRLRHETCSGTQMLLAANGAVPAALQNRDLPLGAFPVESQFRTSLFDIKADAFILSIQADLMALLLRHRSEHFIFHPYEAAHWPAADRHWLRHNFQSEPRISAAASMRNFRTIVQRLRAEREVPILIFNVSSVVPGDAVHCFQGIGETYSTRVQRFNLALRDLSEAIGVSIVDVDTIIARHGGDRHKLDGLHLTPSGYRLVAEEVARILADFALLDAAPEPSCAPA